ncbi:MAG: hypothetical protein JWO86_3713 [Myxococcaceae bacterium]|nr:hypothetical protein [Myxococcaceae bacterium]
MFEEKALRRYPRSLMRVNGDAPWNRRMRIDKQRRMTGAKWSILIRTALAHEGAEIRYDDTHWAEAFTLPTGRPLPTVFGALSIGVLCERDGKTARGAQTRKPSKGRLADRREASGMSSVGLKCHGVSGAHSRVQTANAAGDALAIASPVRRSGVLRSHPHPRPRSRPSTQTPPPAAEAAPRIAPARATAASRAAASPPACPSLPTRSDRDGATARRGQ